MEPGCHSVEVPDRSVDLGVALLPHDATGRNSDSTAADFMAQVMPSWFRRPLNAVLALESNIGFG
jgi:hypothetical protein